MARNAPQITVKDLTKAMQIQDQKTRTELASQSGGNRLEDMTGYGKDWPGTMKDQGFGDEPGTDPAEMIQLELPLDLVKKLQIMAQENPEIAQGISDELMIAGNPSFDINETPATRRTRKIRGLQERGVGGEKGNAGDILKKGIQLPNIQANVNYGPPTERDLFLQRFQGKDGTLRNHPEKIRSTILSIGGRMKADASNNIRSLQSSGHQTVLDDNRPGHLKIIKQFKPKA